MRKCLIDIDVKYDDQNCIDWDSDSEFVQEFVL